MNEIRWGILSTAKIGVEKVIPAIQSAENCTVTALASRTGDKAKKIAGELGIPKAYENYNDLLQDPDIDAIYNPLPNHMHVPWSIKALESGKHVLCEKPIGLSVEDAKKLLKEARRHPDLKIMEAFMYRFHPQWKKARALVQENSIGELQTIQSFFSYYNDDPYNIRNIAEMGGGALMDIGCYCISLSRFLFEREPVRVSANMKFDENFGVDYLTSGLLDFGEKNSTFTCSTQTVPDQRVHILGTEGKITIEIPFNAPPDKETRMNLYTDGNIKTLTFGPADQYALQAYEFTNSILENSPVPTPLEDAVNNMIVIEAIKESSKSGQLTEVSLV